MKAIVRNQYGSADVLQLADIERPRPRPDEVIVRVHAAGIDFGVWHLMEGVPYAVRLATGLRRPRDPVLGTELAGVVVEVGTNVTAFAPGDEVFGVANGSFAEYARASADKLLHKPANLGFAEAAAVPVSATTALTGLRAAKLEAGQTVLITGAGGGVGSYAVQLAHAMGAEVTGVCGTAKQDYVRSLGARHVIDYTREDPTAGERTYDVIIDLAGSREVSALRRVLAPAGTLVILGGEGGGKWLGMGRQLWSQIVGLTTRQKFRSPLALVNQKDLATLKDMLEAGTLTPAVGSRYALSETPSAVRALSAGHSQGKAVITLLASVLLSACSTQLTPTTAHVAGHDVTVVEAGSGDATVVFEAGFGNGWSPWDATAAAVAVEARVFAYSRPGYDASEPTTEPRDPARIVEDLRALLEARGYAPPYVLVGHSFGGTYMELFAKAYPDEVAALVLVDPRHRDFTAACAEAELSGCTIPESAVASLPAVQRAEFAGFAVASDQIAAAGDFGDYPVRVLTGTSHGFTQPVEDLWVSMLGELANEAADGEQVVYPDTGHYPQLSRTSDVVDVILGVLPAPVD